MADLWSLQDELAARGRALRLQAESKAIADEAETDGRQDASTPPPPSP